MNAKERKALETKLGLWRDQLARENVQLSAAQKVVAAASRARQVLRARIERTQRTLAKTTPPGPRRRVVAEALRWVGTTEHPANTNTGPAVDAWEKLWGIHAQPWCGAFAGAMCKSAGAKLTARIVYTPYIYDDAVAGHNGLDHVVWTRSGFKGGHAHSGDLVLYDFGGSTIEHVGILVAPWNGSGPLQTVEGNTSFADGSQSNGGCVARKQRDKSLVAAIVSVKWS